MAHSYGFPGPFHLALCRLHQPRLSRLSCQFGRDQSVLQCHIDSSASHFDRVHIGIVTCAQCTVT